MGRGTFITALFFAAATSGAAQIPAPLPAAGATFRVAYLEVVPSEVPRVVALLKTYRQVVRKVPGLARVETLQQIGRPNFMVIEEKWISEASLQAHLASAEAMTLRSELESALLSPLDERLLAPISAQTANGVVSEQTIYVVTHADASIRRDEVPAMLQELAAGARREAGNLSFEVTVQPNRTNHFTLVEAWTDQKVYETHVSTENTRKFRTAFAPISGALYDERIYKSVP